MLHETGCTIEKDSTDVNGEPEERIVVSFSFTIEEFCQFREAVDEASCSEDIMNDVSAMMTNASLANGDIDEEALFEYVKNLPPSDFHY